MDEKKRNDPPKRPTSYVHPQFHQQVVERLREERDALQRHYDAAAPEHNLLALLDLYEARAINAVEEWKDANGYDDMIRALPVAIMRADRCERECNDAIRQCEIECEAKHDAISTVERIAWNLDEPRELPEGAPSLADRIIEAISQLYRERTEARSEAHLFAEEAQRLTRENAALREAMPSERVLLMFATSVSRHPTFSSAMRDECSEAINRMGRAIGVPSVAKSPAPAGDEGDACPVCRGRCGWHSTACDECDGTGRVGAGKGGE